MVSYKMTGQSFLWRNQMKINQLCVILKYRLINIKHQPIKKRYGPAMLVHKKIVPF